jgi:hypothetical protein
VALGTGGLLWGEPSRAMAQIIDCLEVSLLREPLAAGIIPCGSRDIGPEEELKVRDVSWSGWPSRSSKQSLAALARCAMLF